MLASQVSVSLNSKFGLSHLRGPLLKVLYMFGIYIYIYIYIYNKNIFAFSPLLLSNRLFYAIFLFNFMLQLYFFTKKI